MRYLKNALRILALSFVTMIFAGCERTLFAVINRKVAPPASTVVFDPVHKLALDVYSPKGSFPTPAPVVVFFYGGSWQRGEREQYRFVGQTLAKNGVLTIVADYRTWPRAGFPDFVSDGARAVAWAKKHAAELGGDPQRLFVAGHSAGAQIAALLGTDARYLSAEGLKPNELAGVIGLSGPYNFNITGKYVKIFGPPSRWPDAQAINFVDGDEPPFLLIHGDHDRTVKLRQSVELATKLKQKGRLASLLVLPGASHFASVASLYKPASAPEVLPAILAFIRDPTDNQFREESSSR